MSIRIVVGSEGGERIGQALQLLRRSGAWLPIVMGEIGETVMRHTDERWAKEVDPEGNAWKPLEPKYLRRKQREGHITKILQRTGYMRHSLARQLRGEDTVAVGVTAEYAKHQQDPDKPGRRRPFLGLSTSDRTSILKIVKKHLTDAIGARCA